MPELPEVETVKETLKTKVLGKKIIDVKINYPNVIEYPSSKNFLLNIKNQTINDVKRRGKWLMFELDNYYLLSHLRMEGKFNLKSKDDILNKHEHIIFIFDDGTELRYQDTRKFGRMHLIRKDDVLKTKPLNELGLEPFDDKLTGKYLQEKFKNKKISIKTALLDQSIVVGIGNIYDNEILFLSKVNPLISANEVSIDKLNLIIRNTKKVLNQAIKDGGTTIRSYTSSEGIHGRFQQHLLVHTKENEPCPNCKTPIIKIKVNGRGTYYCPNCQK